MAAPMVTGVAALVWNANPDLSGREVRNILCDPANTLYDCEPYSFGGIQTNSRLLNARLCVEAALAAKDAQ